MRLREDIRLEKGSVQLRADVTGDAARSGQSIGVTAKACTANELRLNPRLAEMLAAGELSSPVPAETAAQTGEF